MATLRLQKDFYDLKGDIYTRHVPKFKKNVLPEETDFQTGRAISLNVPLPILITTGHTLSDPPKSMYISGGIPIMSAELIDALQKVGVTNVQLWPATLKSKTGRTAWENYFVVNILGMVSVEQNRMGPHDGIEVLTGANGVPFKLYNRTPKINPQYTSGLMLFRLLECPMMILISKHAVKQLLRIHGQYEWGISII